MDHFAREEKRFQVTTQGLERKVREGTIFFSPTSNQKQKRIPNRKEISNEILKNTPISFKPNSPNEAMKT